MRSLPIEVNRPRTCPLVVRIAEVDRRRWAQTGSFDSSKKRRDVRSHGGLARVLSLHFGGRRFSSERTSRAPQVAPLSIESAPWSSQYPACVHPVFKSQGAPCDARCFGIVRWSLSEEEQSSRTRATVKGPYRWKALSGSKVRGFSRGCDRIESTANSASRVFFPAKDARKTEAATEVSEVGRHEGRREENARRPSQPTFRMQRANGCSPDNDPPKRWSAP